MKDVTTLQEYPFRAGPAPPIPSRVPRGYSAVMRFDRERYLALHTFGAADRPMFVETMGPLVGLEEEWKAQGASDDELSLRAFDWDYVPRSGCGGFMLPRGDGVTTLIEETAEYRLERDHLGRTVKLMKGKATIPLPMDYPVRTMDDWRKLKPLYQFGEDRVNPEEIERARTLQQEGSLVIAAIPGAFDTPRELMGDENACVCYYEDPELMHDILATLTDTAVRVFERVCDRLVVDQVSVHEDLAGKSGPLAGPRQVEEYFTPYYRGVWDLLASHGSRIFQIDSDGNIEAIVPALLACGITTIIPVEPAAGMDPVRLRERFGKQMSMLGGIDKHVLRSSRQGIRAELEYKMQPHMRSGMVFGLDHRIPNGTPLANYRYYVDTGREILGLPPRGPRGAQWQRMAF